MIMMNVLIDLVFECADAGRAEALDQALAPDNRYFPKDQKFGSERSGASLCFSMSSPRAKPLLSSASSLIADAALFQSIWLETAY